MSSTFPSAVQRPLRVRTPDAGPTPCKICGGNADLFGVQDFARCCEEVRGRYLPLTGVAVYYRRCAGCGLLFTDAFDDWSDEDFAAHIYNESYGEVDPDFEAGRPLANAGMIAPVFQAVKDQLGILDYGGGNGRFAEELRGAGYPLATTYDRFHPAHSARPDGAFRLVTCFETLEHMPDPATGAADIASLVAPDGLLIVSTLLQPQDIAQQRMNWWYIGPRNGHVTLFTHQALGVLFARFGFRILRSVDANLHLLCRQVPDFARHLFPPGTQ
ncbi:MAG TPA: class I SAM-dependent methyltransferase [Caldimonas sp.]|jgi:2-polyprenyl-6-hydroxyphenyl methylase/3-demethylubiquinone-9 3-methyltransferase|nr:class I SAM-dependent methyltransferase [Caldimonas sp.]HEX2540859.1 class I SAM-dependent methyltransferase [Caldimonas sp.]